MFSVVFGAVDTVILIVRFTFRGVSSTDVLYNAVPPDFHLIQDSTPLFAGYRIGLISRYNALRSQTSNLTKERHVSQGDCSLSSTVHAPVHG